MSLYGGYGIHSIETEIKGLRSILEKSLDDSFDLVVKTILNTKGRVILSGVGKPSYIARRVAATFSSIGIPSHFVHANEASHGDLGMILKNDVVILLSNSGESKELNDIIAYCKRYDITLIGITRNQNSFLAQAVMIPIVLENVEQTNVVNSPTTSEIMFLAYLDAIATALINVKNFNNDDYKILHPGGKLGASLLKVGDIMRKRDEVPLIQTCDTMEKMINVMIEKPLGCVGILDDKQKLVGIITDGDFKRKIIQYPDLMKCKVTDIMTKNPITISKDRFALDAVKQMQHGTGKNNNYIQVLFVVNQDNELVGLLHIQDCLKNGII